MAVRALFAGVVSGAASALALRLLRDVPPGGRTCGTAPTMRARQSPAGGPGVRRGVVAGRRRGRARTTRRGARCRLLGALDDLAGDSRSKGLTGHLGALARGEVTTGAVKVPRPGVTGVLARHSSTAADGWDGQPLRALDTLVVG